MSIFEKLPSTIALDKAIAKWKADKDKLSGEIEQMLEDLEKSNKKIRKIIEDHDKRNKGKNSSD